jgi:hypothetical protein
MLDVDGNVECDITASLVGKSTYTGTCDTCDYEFDVESTTTADASTRSDCTEEFGVYLFQDPYGKGFDMYWGFSSVYKPYNDVISFGYQAYGYSTYWSPLIADGVGYSYKDASLAMTVTVTGSDVDWSLDATYSGYSSGGYYYDGSSCSSSYGYNYAYNAYPSKFYSTDDLAMYAYVYGSSTYYLSDGSYDVWDFTTDGGSTYITVDTVSKGTAFDGYLWVTDGSSCYLGGGDDNFACTYPPPSYACPSIGLPSTDGGTWQVVVAGYSGASTSGEYQLHIDQKSDPSLTLIQDDYNPAGGTTTSTLSVSGSATLK